MGPVRIILASQSPRRRELLERMGILNFEIIPARGEEIMDPALPPEHCAAARGAVWDAFFRQNLDLLPTVLPDALRSVSSSLLTDLTALDYAALERTLEFLANNTAAVEAQTLPGDWDAVGGTYTLNEASLAAVQAFFNASPTDAQASSASEP